MTCKFCQIKTFQCECGIEITKRMDKRPPSFFLFWNRDLTTYETLLKTLVDVLYLALEGVGIPRMIAVMLPPTMTMRMKMLMILLSQAVKPPNKSQPRIGLYGFTTQLEISGIQNSKCGMSSRNSSLDLGIISMGKVQGWSPCEDVEPTRVLTVPHQSQMSLAKTRGRTPGRLMCNWFICIT